MKLEQDLLDLAEKDLDHTVDWVALSQALVEGRSEDARGLAGINPAAVALVHRLTRR